MLREAEIPGEQVRDVCRKYGIAEQGYTQHSILGLTLQPLEVHTSDDFDRSFAVIARERPDALLITGDAVHQLHVGRIIDFAIKMRLPSMYQLKENVIAGGLMSYGASLPELFRRGALYYFPLKITPTRRILWGLWC